MEALRLLVTFHVKPGCREAFVNEMFEQGIHEAVNKEDGCIKYDYYFDPKDESIVLLVEKWESREKQQIHIQTPHMQRAREINKKYVENATLEEF